MSLSSGGGGSGGGGMSWGMSSGASPSIPSCAIEGAARHSPKMTSSDVALFTGDLLVRGIALRPASVRRARPKKRDVEGIKSKGRMPYEKSQLLSELLIDALKIAINSSAAVIPHRRTAAGTTDRGPQASCRERSTAARSDRDAACFHPPSSVRRRVRPPRSVVLHHRRGQTHWRSFSGLRPAHHGSPAL